MWVYTLAGGDSDRFGLRKYCTQHTGRSDCWRPSRRYPDSHMQAVLQSRGRAGDGTAVGLCHWSLC